MVADEPTFARLMVAAQDGDKAAANALLTEVGVWLERYFRRRVPPHQTDDLVQEVLIAFYTKRATWDPKRPFLPWLAAISRYRWVDHLRKVYKHDAKELMEDDAVEDSDEEVVMARVSLDRLLSQLPDKQASVIEMVKISGLSIREAAEKTGQSESLVKVNIHRGLKKLATMVEEVD
ncbi:MAG: sigma-70 family RNA polymerase sigma factor [Pseudomonadota bacterium]